jgi:aminoglycoside 6-adenylyltransferase
MMDGPVRQMFMRMIAWYIGTETGFSISFGKEGKNMKDHLDKHAYQRILETYPDYKIDNIWSSLFLMTDLFSLYTVKVSDFMQFRQNHSEFENVTKFLIQQFTERE